MPSSVYRWSIFSIKLQTQKERHGVGERRANPETTLPSRPPGPLAAAGLPGGTPAGARLFYALFGVDNPPGPIYSGLVPKGSRRLSPPRRHTRPMKVTCARMSSTAQRFAPGRGLSCLGIFSRVQSRVPPKVGVPAEKAFAFANTFPSRTHPSATKMLALLATVPSAFSGLATVRQRIPSL